MFVASSVSFFFVPDNGVSLPCSLFTVTFSLDACVTFAVRRLFIMS